MVGRSTAADDLADGPLTLSVTVGDPDAERRERRSLELSPGQIRQEWFLLPLITSGQAVVQVSNARGEVLGRQLIGHDVDQARRYGFWATYRDVVRLVYVPNDERWRPDHGLHVFVPSSGYQEGGRTVQQYRFQLAARTLAELPPSPFGYDGCDLVLVHGADLTLLDASQQAALERWIRAGGRLVLIPEEGRGKEWLTSAGVTRLTGGLQPAATAVATDRLGLTGLGGASIEYLELVAPPNTRPRRHGDRGLPLAYALPLGAGEVVVVPFDLHELILNRRLGAQQTSDLLYEVLHYQRIAGNTQWRQRYAGWGSADALVRPGAVQHLNSRRPPPPSLVFGLVLGYLLCVGPLNYLLLRRRGQRALQVVTVPLLSLMFVGLVFLSGYVSGRLRTQHWRLTVVEAELGSAQGWQQTLLSTAAPLGGNYEVVAQPELAVARLLSSDYDPWSPEPNGRLPLDVARRGDGLQRYGFGLGARELGCLEAQAPFDLGQGIVLRGQERDPVAIANNSSLDLAGGVVLVDDRVLTFPAIPAGGQAPLEAFERWPLRAGDTSYRGPDLIAEEQRVLTRLASQLAPGAGSEELTWVLTTLDQRRLALAGQNRRPLLLGRLTAPPLEVTTGDGSGYDRELNLLVLHPSHGPRRQW